MFRYYVNRRKDENGKHEVHREGCSWLNLILDREYLGEHDSCFGATVKAILEGYSPVDGCAHCCPECHTS